MFTVKLYRDNGARQRVYEAESFTILRPCSEKQGQWAEITAHRKSGDDIRFDIGDTPHDPEGGVWEKAILENALGRTTEIIAFSTPFSHSGPPRAGAAKAAA